MSPPAGESKSRFTSAVSGNIESWTQAERYNDMSLSIESETFLWKNWKLSIVETGAAGSGGNNCIHWAILQHHLFWFYQAVMSIPPRYKNKWDLSKCYQLIWPTSKFPLEKLPLELRAASSERNNGIHCVISQPPFLFNQAVINAVLIKWD